MADVLKIDGSRTKRGKVDAADISPQVRPFKTALTVSSNGQNMFLLGSEITALLSTVAAKTDTSLKVENAEYDLNTDYIFIPDGSDLYVKWVSTKFTLKIADKVELRR